MHQFDILETPKIISSIEAENVYKNIFLTQFNFINLHDEIYFIITLYWIWKYLFGVIIK